MNELLEIRLGLQRLEKAIRRWRVIALSALGLAALAAFLGLVQSGHAQQIIQGAKPSQAAERSPLGGATQVADTIVARKIVLGDGRKPGLVLTPDAVSVFDSEGREITRVDHDGFLLLDGRRSMRASLTADSDGSYLYLRDSKGRDRCYIRAVNIGPAYMIVDENGVKWNVLLYDHRRVFGP